MNNFIIEFVSASVLMGLAIGLDAAIATAVKAKSIRSSRDAAHWLIGISLTHTVFPMIGYLLSYFSIEHFPLLSPIVGLIAFALIAHYLLDEIKGMHRKEQESSSSFLVDLGLILTVSWDALWSGPAKSAQVIGWPEFAIWSSFIIVGSTVSILSCLAYCLSCSLPRKRIQPVGSRRLNILQWLQFSAISYFGWLALTRYTFGWQLPAVFILFIAMLVMLVVMQPHHWLAYNVGRSLDSRNGL